MLNDKEETAIIKLLLSNGVEELTITRKLKPNGTQSVAISSTDKTRHLTQKDLDMMFNNALANPIRFMELKGVKQAKLLGIDTSKYDDNYKDLYAERTEIHRDKQSILKQRDRIEIPDDTPESLIDVEEIQTELDSAKDLHSENNRTIETIQQNIATIKANKNEIIRLQNEIESYQKSIDECEIWNNENKPIENLPEIESIQQRLHEANTSNNQFNLVQGKRELRNDLNKQYSELETGYKEHTESIEANTKARAKYIASCDLPFENMDYVNDRLTLDGRPIDTYSDGEILEISAKLLSSKACAIPLMFIENGSLMDKQKLEMLEVIANDNNIMILVEIVGDKEQRKHDNDIVISEVI